MQVSGFKEDINRQDTLEMVNDFFYTPRYVRISKLVHHSIGCVDEAKETEDILNSICREDSMKRSPRKSLQCGANPC